jgi:hypothetical protein
MNPKIIPAPLHSRNSRRLLRFVLVMFVIFASPSGASEFWEEPCQKDLSRALFLGVMEYDFYKNLPPTIGRRSLEELA